METQWTENLILNFLNEQQNCTRSPLLCFTLTLPNGHLWNLGRDCTIGHDYIANDHSPRL